MSRLKNKVVIVVGSTSGIGKACAQLFAQEGAKVVFTGRREEQGKEIEAAIRAKGFEATFIKADSTLKEDLQTVVDFTIKKYGKIDVLHNNAGILIEASILDIDLVNNYDKVMNVNVRSYLVMTQMVLPHMLKAGKGSIINTSSVGARFAVPNYVPYTASKAAVSHMTRTMAKELGSTGVRVNSLCPGNAISDMVPEGGEFEAKTLPLIPMGRSGSSLEQAYGALFLASDESSYMTGAELLIDGGLSL